MPILADFDYIRPKTIDETLEILSGTKKTKILAGGTDLIVQLKEEVIAPEIIIDVKDLQDFNKIEYNGEFVTIGAGVTFTQIIESDILKEKLPLLCQTAEKVASVGIRNRATLVGNICSAVPSLDSAPALLNYEAIVVVKSKTKEREISIHEWFVAPKKTVLKDDEIVTEIKIKVPKKHLSEYQKLGRYNGEDLAQAGVGILLFENKKIRASVCAVGPIPKRLKVVESYLNDNGLSDEAIEKAVEMIDREISPITDIRATEKYRRHMTKVMFARGLKNLIEKYDKGGLK